MTRSIQAVERQMRALPSKDVGNTDKNGGTITMDEWVENMMEGNG